MINSCSLAGRVLLYAWRGTVCAISFESLHYLCGDRRLGSVACGGVRLVAAGRRYDEHACEMCVPILPVHVCTYFEIERDRMHGMAMVSGSKVSLCWFHG